MVEHDGFEIIDGPLPHRPSTTASTATATAASTAPTVVDEANPEAATVDLRRLPEKNALLVSVNPPPKPQNDIPHVPCDIVLVIDVSGSMSAAAPLPLEDESAQAEKSGLSVLDLTKHAARTIIETLNESDRLGVVTFSSEARVSRYIPICTKSACLLSPVLPTYYVNTYIGRNMRHWMQGLLMRRVLRLYTSCQR